MGKTELIWVMSAANLSYVSRKGWSKEALRRAQSDMKVHTLFGNESKGSVGFGGLA